MKEKEYYIDQDGFKLHAKLAFPETEEEKYPVVILVHGLTGHMEEPHIIAIRDTVAECGYACLRVELYGHGMSDGEFKHHNVMEWVMELIRVIDHVREWEQSTDIILAGHSQGGLATILTAGLKADQLKAIIPLSPATCIRDSCLEGDFFGQKFDSKTIPEELHFWEDKVVTGNYVRVGRVLPIEQSIAAYDGPALVIHGTKDESVPYACGVAAAAGYKNGTLVSIEGDSHCYDYHVDQVCDAVRAFLLELKAQ